MTITVEDAEQGRGIGSLLLEHLARIAVQCGVVEFEIDTLANNAATLCLARGLGMLSRSSDCGVVHIVSRIDRSADAA